MSKQPYVILGDDDSHGRLVRIHPQYLSKLKHVADLDDASIEALVNQAVSDMLESA